MLPLHRPTGVPCISHPLVKPKNGTLLNMFNNGRTLLYEHVVQHVPQQGSLIAWMLTACQHRKVNLGKLRRKKLTPMAKYGQRHPMHNTLRYTLTL